MVDMSFLYSYKSALYRVALDKEPEDLVSLHCLPLNMLRSLLDLSALHIVGNASLMAVARTTVPTELHDTLLKAALLLSNDTAIEQLMSAWPWKVLTLRNFAQPIFSSLNPLFCEIDLCEQMRRGVKHTTCLAHIFMECLKRRDSTKLRCLDLTGYPCAEIIVNYIASHVLLVYNEARQRQIIQVYNSVTQELPLEQKRQYSLEYTFPDEKFVFSIDAMLQTEDAHMELCRALSVSRLPESCLKLRINKLDMSCLGVARIVVLLELLDPEFLTGISVQYNAITNQGLAVIAPPLKKFSHLTGLDLSSNSINATTQNEEAAVILSDIVANLPSLQRLNLSSNNMKGSLYKILSSTVQPLTMLRASGCGLTERDLACLLHSGHPLEELDIGENALASCFPLVLSLVRALAPSLVILEMEDVRLRSDEFSLLFETCLQLRKLRLLNVARNGQLLRAVVVDSIAFLIMTPRLQAVKLSYPTDIEVDDGMDERQIAGRKKEFSHLIDHVVGRLCVLHKRCALRLAFKL